MPIIGLTTERESLDYGGLPTLGYLRKGAEKQPNRPGKDLDYFRIEFLPQFQHLLPVWESLYGEEPKEFKNVRMAGATIDDVFPTWNEHWSKTTLVRRCTGQHIVRWYDHESGRYSSELRPCETPTCECKPSGRLRIFLPDFLQAVAQKEGVVTMGTFLLLTTSRYDLLEMSGVLHQIYRMTGDLRSVPFMLGRAPKEVSTQDDKGQRRRQPKNLVYLHAYATPQDQSAMHALMDGFKSYHPPTVASGSAELPALGTGDIEETDDIPFDDNESDPVEVLEEEAPIDEGLRKTVDALVGEFWDFATEFVGEWQGVERAFLDAREAQDWLDYAKRFYGSKDIASLIAHDIMDWLIHDIDFSMQIDTMKIDVNPLGKRYLNLPLFGTLSIRDSALERWGAESYAKGKKDTIVSFDPGKVVKIDRLDGEGRQNFPNVYRVVGFVETEAADTIQEVDSEDIPF